MFRKTTGSTFTEFHSRVRIQCAEAALRNPNSRVSEIAFAVGFRSLSQFNRAFRRLHVLSPRTWRESA
jgi:AraC-like DNA-binding protein